ncbi:exodeoxyribonuclease VII large subunit, partial [Streptomyces sp. SID11233]|nr:exodeoxyribonuclease VII large subunit [Streptomyces sp. SID11233]
GEELERVRQTRDRGRYAIRALVEREAQGLEQALAHSALRDPYRLVAGRDEEIGAEIARARRTVGHLLDRADSDLTHTLARVVALSPAATLRRGY